MKKFFAVLSLSALLSTAVSAATTYQTGNWYYNSRNPGPGNSYAGSSIRVSGIQVDLTSSWVKTTSEGAAALLPSEVELTSISFLNPDFAYSPDNPVKIAIADMWGAMHFSSGQVVRADYGEYDEIRFSFDSLVVLNASDIQSFWFVSTDVTSDNWQEKISSFYVEASNPSAFYGPVPYPTTGQGAVNVAGQLFTNATPLIQITTQSWNVPEPSSAMFLVFASCGLLVRRCRR